MKKVFLGSALLLLTATLFAQPGHNDGPPKPPPVAERWKRDSIKLQLYVALQLTQISPVKNVFYISYQNMDALVEKSKGTPPAKEEMEKLHNGRNNALKTIFNAGQFDRYETFEREFMPPPPPMQRGGRP